MVEQAKSDQKRAEFLAMAGAAYDRMLREEQEGVVTFVQMEARALEVGGRMERWLMEQSLAQQGARIGQAPAAVCPQCRHPVPRTQGKEAHRRVLGRTGPAEFSETVYRCPSCRKAFSPSEPPSAVGWGGV